MNVLNYTSLRTKLKEVLDTVINDNETVVINRGSKNAVIISLDEYNSWMETMHLMSTKTNRDRLEIAIERDRKGQKTVKPLIKD
jgi:antitoxin YefM